MGFWIFLLYSITSGKFLLHATLGPKPFRKAPLQRGLALSFINQLVPIDLSYCREDMRLGWKIQLF